MGKQFISVFCSGSSCFIFVDLLFCQSGCLIPYAGALVQYAFCYLLHWAQQLQQRESRASWLTHTEAKWIIFILLEGSALHTVGEQQLTASLFLSDRAAYMLEVLRLFPAWKSPGVVDDIISHLPKQLPRL